MRIFEILSELTFQGSRCTKDCGGHGAGYAWAKQRGAGAACNSHSQSFNNGCEIAKRQAQQGGKMVRPKIRDVRGRFAAGPQPRKPAAPKPTGPVAPIKPV